VSFRIGYLIDQNVYFYKNLAVIAM